MEDNRLTPRSLAKKIAEFAISKKAFDVVLIDLRKLDAVTDFFLVCSADSETQVKAIADAIKDESQALGISLWHSEGYRALTWVLLDYVDVVVHIFHKEARKFYNLERLWSDAKTQAVKDVGDGIRISAVTRKKATTKLAKSTKKVSA